MRSILLALALTAAPIAASAQDGAAPAQDDVAILDVAPAQAIAPVAEANDDGEALRRNAIGGTVRVIDQPGDVSVFGGNVTIDGAVGGDVFIAGGNVLGAGSVGGDLRILGGDVEIHGPVQGELSAAGGSVLLDSRVGAAMQAAAGEIRLGPNADIARDVRLGGGDISIEGRIGGDLDVAAEQVFIDATIAGDARVRARRITLGPRARLEGGFEWSARTAPEQAQGAVVLGALDGRATSRFDFQEWREWTPRILSPAASFAAAAIWTLAWAFSAFLIGVLIAFAAPGVFERVHWITHGRWPGALGWGMVLLVAPIVMGIALIVTLVGLPFGILILSAYPFLLAAGYAMGGAVIGALLIRGHGLASRLGDLAAGIIVLAALSFIPVIGALAGFIALLLGLGLFALRPEPVTPPQT